MKKLMLALIALVGLGGSALHAQDVSGIWQGTITPPQGKPLRVVFKFVTADDKMKATLFSIDQGGRPLPMGVVSVQGGTVKFGSPGFASYEGKLAADGKTITGSWIQGDSTPLVLTHMTEATAWAIPEAPAQLPPMAKDANPSFEVATIKPSKPDQPGKAFSVRGRQISTFNTTMVDMISFAYGVHAKQISGGAPWMETDKFDVTGTPDVPGQPNSDQLKTMMKKLLTERFQLKFHHDKKELSAYALTVSKTGVKITKSESDPNAPPALFFRQLGQMTVRNGSMTEFAQVMQAAVLDRPVVDQTGLAGKYDFPLNWTPDESQFGGMGIKVPPPSDKADAPPGLFTALPEQTGLRLDATKTAVDVMVIDHVEKPSEN